MKRLFLLLVFCPFLYSCNKADRVTPDSTLRKFETSFESVDEFSNFYVTPQGHLGTTFHELSDSIVRSGDYAHKAWINGSNQPSITTNNNHRGYPTFQFQKSTEGVLKTPCYVTLWVWLDIDLQKNSSGGEDDWFSFATFTDDETDDWDRSVLINLSYDGYIHLQNTTQQGSQEHILRTESLKFPQREWVELKMYLDLRENGYAKVWQNGSLVAHAEIGDIQNKLSQAHFGMYCPPQLTSGIVFNDDLVFEEVNGE